MTTNSDNEFNEINKPTVKPFVTNKDKETLEREGVNFDEDMIMLLLELRLFFTKVWEPRYHKELENLEDKDLDHFNKIIDYPSWGGYHILEDSFTSVSDEDFAILSDRSKELIGYFYGIHFH